jgi:hypothetical protein
MSYDPKFYEMYEEYLKEPTVRENHDFAFDVFTVSGEHMENNVVDFGCGTGEFKKHSLANLSGKYVGIDKVKSPAADIIMDYTQELPHLPFEPDAFVSIFSIEACLPSTARFDLYGRIFDRYPSIKKALVSGFYYEGKKDQLTVAETGGIVSHQTIDTVADSISTRYTEKRITMRTPSRMFGHDVIEVWKILERHELR